MYEINILINVSQFTGRNISKLLILNKIVAKFSGNVMNQDNYLIYSLGFVLVLVSTIKYILIKRYIYIISSKINFKNKEIEWF